MVDAVMNGSKEKLAWSAPTLEVVSMARTSSKGGTTVEGFGVDS